MNPYYPQYPNAFFQGPPSHRQFPQYPQSEQMAQQQIKQPLYPQLKEQTLSTIAPFVNYGLQEAQATSFEHALTEVAAMSYLMGRGLDPQTAYLTVESWEVNEQF